MSIKYTEIKTDRLILNQPVESDIKNIKSLLNEKIFSELTVNIPYPYSESDAEFWINLSKIGLQKMEQLIFAIRLKENNTIIGGIDLGIQKRFNKAELAYWIGKPYWNKGYATEASKAIIKFGFSEINLKRIYATHFLNNQASGKVMLKSGMEKEGKLKCHTKKGNEYQDHIIYGITNNEI